jgi:hypothetical protein
MSATPVQVLKQPEPSRSASLGASVHGRVSVQEAVTKATPQADPRKVEQILALSQKAAKMLGVIDTPATKAITKAINTATSKQVKAIEQGKTQAPPAAGPIEWLQEGWNNLLNFGQKQSEEIAEQAAAAATQLSKQISESFAATSTALTNLVSQTIGSSFAPSASCPVSPGAPEAPRPTNIPTVVPTSEIPPQPQKAHPFVTVASFVNKNSMLVLLLAAAGLVTVVSIGVSKMRRKPNAHRNRNY